MGKLKFNLVKAFCSTLVLAAALAFSPSVDAKAASNDELIAASKIFDGAYYAALYPDVAASVNGSQLGLLNHYVYYGVYEGRNASASFNATDYMNKNPDLQAVYGDNMIAYVHHYVNAGQAEGRDATPVAGTEIAVPANYTLLGIYSTEYVSTQDRATNIKIAADHVNGTVVAPGATFSANRAIGPRTTKNGFVEAPVFINKQHARGIGGGVCQVSSTIYAAMKTAGIQASERHPHSLPVAYLPAGWDATISGNALDLKFVNRYDKNIVVYETANSGILTAAIYLEN